MTSRSTRSISSSSSALRAQTPPSASTASKPRRAAPRRASRRVRMSRLSGTSSTMRIRDARSGAAWAGEAPPAIRAAVGIVVVAMSPDEAAAPRGDDAGSTPATAGPCPRGGARVPPLGGGARCRLGPSRRGGEGAVGSSSSMTAAWSRAGRVTAKREPWPCRRATAISPPSRVQKRFERARPIPVPPKREPTDASACSYSVRSRGRASGAMPMPVSAITARGSAPSGPSSTPRSSLTRPRSVSLPALDGRSMRIWRRFLGSVGSRRPGSGQETTKRVASRSNTSRALATTSSRISPSLTGASSTRVPSRAMASASSTLKTGESGCLPAASMWSTPLIRVASPPSSRFSARFSE